ncbi:hypothetical protein V500_05676 [Pseudogymnoascus sp. VKM F-4518 (FW-2643)]|nr:hypothetical protein V500_05676 [Pseudogymnoascus sp. VKM F-4518 (FW-2643)]
MSASNPSILLDKLNGRRSTPDSEALASSDDEGDNQQRQENTIPAAAPHKPVRRASWLNDTTQPLSQPRKGSFASSTMSPTASHPTTPSTETGAWGAHTSTSSATATGRVPPGSTSFPWGSGIWNNEARKDPPHRLSEVLPSPTSLTGGFANNGLFNTDNSNSQGLTASRDAPAETTIPFAIPLHPTPKTYRSQSYSVGQLDPESNVPGAGILPGPGFNGRGRGMHHSGLQHRPSRPSMLSEVSSDGTGLGKVKEVDDDDLDDFDNMAHGSQLQDQAKVLEALARENAMLRKQNYHNSRLRPRSATSTSLAPFQPGYTYGLQDTLPEESDYAIDEIDEMGELQDIGNKSMLARRLSEYGEGHPGRGGYGAAENRKLENVKKAIWQSSLGFGGLSDISQSRRHSFADVPTRHASVGSAEQMGGRENGHQEQILPQDVQSRYADSTDFTINDHGKHALSTTAHPFLSPGVNYSREGNTAVSYFGGAPVQGRNAEAYGLPPYQQASAYQPYPAAPAYGSAQPTSPHRNIYSVPQPRQNQLLYIVLFKCSRADVFYVQEGTGLSVKPGDLVIVEADRGTDLGTVAQDNVDWATAKELKEHYAEEHYKWLMMYSQGAVGTADGTGAGLMAASNGLQGSAVGGMGPPTQHGMQEPNPGELKPKIIKRLAQNHEIQALRDKEGNEAKAKRVCMQKVKEHGLHMEILDAEFQMDWKKLTFYYFADAYINFNSLVTDLFKVYKTRIWMSAINPASFASPSLGLQAPSGVGPGAVGANRQTQIDRRPQQPPQQEQPNFNTLGQGARGYKAGGAANAFQPTLDKPSVSPTSFQQPFTYGHSAFTPAPRNGPGNYGPNMMQQMESFSQFPTAADYHGGVPDRFIPSHTTGNGQDPGDFSRPGGDNDGWMNSFQGLSLNSR